MWVVHEVENAMTRDRRHKAEIRARQASTGTAYMVARRQITLLTMSNCQYLWIKIF
jgi:hypothetical protein